MRGLSLWQKIRSGVSVRPSQDQVKHDIAMADRRLDQMAEHFAIERQERTEDRADERNREDRAERVERTRKADVRGDEERRRRRWTNGVLPTFGAVALFATLAVAGIVIRNHDQAQVAKQRDLCLLAHANSRSVRAIAESQVGPYRARLTDKSLSPPFREALIRSVQTLDVQIETLKHRETVPCR